MIKRNKYIKLKWKLKIELLLNINQLPFYKKIYLKLKKKVIK